MIAKTETATFSAGCFWDVEAAFRRQPGVLRTSVGFMGGRTEGPTYDQVCIGNTGHAEVVQVVYAPDQMTYGDLLELFWTIHDPTTWVKPNSGSASQYRSAIFYHSDEQAAHANASKEQHQPHHHNAIASEIVPAGIYTRAERSHQHYEEKRERLLSLRSVKSS